jgi:hypothetical protein
MKKLLLAVAGIAAAAFLALAVNSSASADEFPGFRDDGIEWGIE